MSGRLLPVPDTHCWDDDLRKDVWSYSADAMRAHADAVETAAMQSEAASWGENASMQAAEIRRLSARVLELEALLSVSPAAKP